MKKAEGGGTYLYAVLAGGGGNYGPIGVGKGEVHCLVEGGLAAAVSAARAGHARPERRNLAAHQAVLERLMRQSTVLPASFGLIARNDEAVRRALRDNADLLREQLEHVAGKVEMGIRVRWSAADVFGHFVATHAPLREARDRLRARGRVSRDEKIAVGQMFERIRDADREAHAARVAAALEALGAEVKLDEPRGEREVMSLACLLPREELAAFERAVEEVAAEFDEHFTFSLTGPWAPYNFTSLRLAG